MAAPSPVAIRPVAGPLLALRRCCRASTGTAGGPACRCSVAGPGPVAAPSLGSYRPSIAVAGHSRPRRQAPSCPAALSPGTCGGSVSWLILAATRLHVRTASTPVGKVTTPLACPYCTNARGQSRHPVACQYCTNAHGPCQPSNTAQCPEKLAWCFHN